MESASCRSRTFDLSPGTCAKIDRKDGEEFQVGRIVCCAKKGRQVDPSVRARFHSERGAQFENVLRISAVAWSPWVCSVSPASASWFWPG